jgi:hypothetical protein
VLIHRAIAVIRHFDFFSNRSAGCGLMCAPFSVFFVRDVLSPGKPARRNHRDFACLRVLLTIFSDGIKTRRKKLGCPRRSSDLPTD